MSARRLSAISVFTALVLIASFAAAFLPQAISPQPAEAAYITVVYGTAGTFTWTAPVGVTSVIIECWGGGGRGGTMRVDGGGGGGGGGAYSKKTVTVTPGAVYTLVVGAGSTTTAAGGDSYFISAATVMAKGGGTVGNNIAAGAAGGSATASVGTVKYSGGSGASGVAGSYGGGGGSSAGTAANGNNATGSSGAVAPSGGGKGGNGRTGTQGKGSVGTAPGGGGGGALRMGNGNRGGGAGGVGMVTISYQTGASIVIGTVSLWDHGNDTVDPAIPPAEVSYMNPQAEYDIKIPVSVDTTFNDLDNIKATIYYDADGIYNPGEVPGAGNAQTCAILTWTRATNTLTVEAGSPSTWTVNNAASIFPSLGVSSGTFEFHFVPGKVATKTVDPARWHIYVVGTDTTAHTGTGYKSNITMNWYGEVVVNTPSVDWESVSAGLDFADSDPSRETGISLTFISNGAYSVQVKALTTWTGSGASNAVLKPDGNPGPNQFSLRADRDDTMSGSLLVPAIYATVYTGTLTTESGTTESSNSLWLKLGSPFVTGRYTGIVYYRIISS